MFHKLSLTLVLLFQTALPVWGQDLQPFNSFPEVGISLQAPAGFEKATAFYGFQQPETQSSILLSAIPGPFSELMDRLTAQQLKTQGVRLLSKQSVMDDKVLIHGAQKVNGQTFLKWIVLFKDAQGQAKVVMATFPKAQAHRLSAPLKEAVLSVALLPADADPQAKTNLPFSITPSPQLAEVTELRGAGVMQIFSKDGVWSSKPAPEEPVLIVAPSLGPVIIADREMFARHRLMQYPQLESVAVESVNAIALDQQQGFEIIATAIDRDSQTPLRIYQVMLFPEAGGYVVIVGMVGLDGAAQYLPAFQSTARTYRASPPVGTGESVQTR
jgi:hypothetical protein